MEHRCFLCKCFCCVWHHHRFAICERGTCSNCFDRHPCEIRLAKRGCTEGVLWSHRNFLKTATCATVAQDATGNTMVARFISSQGILGLQRNYGSGHKAVLEATKQMCTDFMTPLHGAPVRAQTRSCLRQPEPVPDQEALQHLRDIVRLWCADAAGDEQLAGREAGPLSGSLAPFFPNLELVLRDTAHASRRLIEFSV